MLPWALQIHGHGGNILVGGESAVGLRPTGRKHWRLDVERMAPRHERAGFTLVEMLVVIGIISILAGITIPAITGQTRAARRINCASNLSQIGKGLYTYMDNWDRMFIANRPAGVSPQRKTASGAAIATFVAAGYDDLSPLWGVPTARVERTGSTFEFIPVWTSRFVGDIRAFNCPSTRDVAGTLPEPTGEEWGDTFRPGWWHWKEIRYKRSGSTLVYTWNTGTSKYDVTAGTPDPRPRLSYEYNGEFNPSMQYTGINPSLAWLAHDEDANNENTNDVLRLKKYETIALTKDSNHGKTGGNMLFLDGRVEWIAAMNWIERVTNGIREWERITNWKLPDAFLGIP